MLARLFPTSMRFSHLVFVNFRITRRCTHTNLPPRSSSSALAPTAPDLPTNPQRIGPVTRRPRNAPAPAVYVETGLRIALVGRPNVGKSTLFNRLASAVHERGSDGSHNPSPLVFVRSVVDSAPGVTRDPREAAAAISDLRFSLIDTAGLEDVVKSPNSERKATDGEGDQADSTSLINMTAHCDAPMYRKLYERMEDGTVEAVRESNLVFFVIDAAVGITEIDKALAAWLRVAAAGKEVLVVANKCDIAEAESNVLHAYELGFGEPIVVSAEQNLGFADLYLEIDSVYAKRIARGDTVHEEADERRGRIQRNEHKGEEEGTDDWEEELVVGYGERKGDEPLKQLVVSLLGRPNVGKSTLLNRLVGQERSLVGPVAGVTRDAVLCEWKLPPGVGTPDQIPVWLMDTAGIRSRMRVGTDNLERLSVRSSLRALRNAHVVIIVLDSDDPLCHQDMKLLDVVVTEGRAVVLVVNKMDKLNSEDLAEWRLRLRHNVDHRVSSLAGVEVVEMSAKDWKNGEKQGKRLFEAVQRARERWEKRISTSALNRFVTQFNERISVGKGFPGKRRNRIGVTKFITQKKIRPPMFRLDGSSAVSLNYLRMLTNAIRQEFGFEGVPIRVKRPSRRGRK